ncbi:MAG: hypothetical protein P1U34_05620 [Coxiellaceae bacterium]|nr:hypothetical protein [Coxiellaceae bacterium]
MTKIFTTVAFGMTLLMSSIAFASNPPDGDKTAYKVKWFSSDKKPSANKVIKCGKGQAQELDANGHPHCVSKPAPQKKKSSSWW